MAEHGELLDLTLARVEVRVKDVHRRIEETMDSDYRGMPPPFDRDVFSSSGLSRSR